MHKLHPNDRIYLHGVSINTLDRASAEEFIAEQLKKDGGDLPRAIFTPNAEMVFRAARDPRLADLLNSGDLNTPDGIGVIWASKHMGYSLPERIAGIDLGEYAVSYCAERGYKVFLLGGADGVAERAAEKLVEKYPDLLVCGTHHGYFTHDSLENEEVIKTISQAAPDLLIVCLGFPRQESWIMANRYRLPYVKLMIALGGSLDVWSGHVRRAPAAIQRLRLEWLWRVLREPSRLPRAAALPKFVAMTLRAERVKKRNFKAKLS